MTSRLGLVKSSAREREGSAGFTIRLQIEKLPYLKILEKQL